MADIKETISSREDWDPMFHFFPTGLDFEGCACAEGIIEGTLIEAHCHRTGCYFGCEYAGVHFSGDIEVARKVADYIANAYSCDVTIVDIGPNLIEWMNNG